MADYYSLLARAIAALPQSAPEARQAVYERARKALFNQLRSIQPPVAEADIEAEGRALDEAIARLELEAVRESASFASNKAAQPAEQQKSPRGAPAPKSPASGGARSAEQPASPEAVSPAQPLQPQRPAAPLPPLPQPASNSRRILMIAAVLTIVVGAVALVALQLREQPEDLARLTPDDSAADSVETGKIADRIGGESTQTDEPATVATARPQAETAGAPVLPVAQKAELWVAAPEEASKVKIYSGSVVWRLENVGGGEGQPLTSAIRGDIDIAPAKMRAALVIQKNLDPTLSASHTINVTFNFAQESDLKGVKAIGPVQMRRPEAQSGEQVAGIPVPITENKFLIGLLRGDREARNVTLLRSPMVVDLPMQLADGRAATISMEKGPAGERVFADALEAWARR